MSEIQINVQDVLNNLTAKLSDAEMRATMAEAEKIAYARRINELEQIVADLNAELAKATRSDAVSTNGQVVEVD